MLTRNKYNPGYYVNLINGLNSPDKNENNKKNIEKKDININDLIKSINYNILKNLKSKRKSSPTVILKFNINYKVFNYLKTNFQISARFEENKEFLSKYNLESERCQNEKYYATANNFEFKIMKGRKLKFNQCKDGRIISREITSNHQFCVSFLVKNFP